MLALEVSKLSCEMIDRKTEFLVGLFLLTGLCAVLYLAISIGGGSLFSQDYYLLQARFSSASGVNPGSRVEIAGVPVGRVQSIELDARFSAIISLEIDRSIDLDDDTIASIKTAGLIGDRFIKLSPGGSGILLEPGDLILDTESALDIEELISRFAMGNQLSK